VRRQVQVQEWGGWDVVKCVYVWLFSRQNTMHSNIITISKTEGGNQQHCSMLGGDSHTITSVGQGVNERRPSAIDGLTSASGLSVLIPVAGDSTD